MTHSAPRTTGSDPQHRGLGTALLACHLHRLDRLRRPTCPHATGDRAVDFYRTSGFTGHGTPVTLAAHPGQIPTPTHRAPALTLPPRRSRGTRR